MNVINGALIKYKSSYVFSNGTFTILMDPIQQYDAVDTAAQVTRYPSQNGSYLQTQNKKNILTFSA